MVVNCSISLIHGCKLLYHVLVCVLMQVCFFHHCGWWSVSFYHLLFILIVLFCLRVNSRLKCHPHVSHTPPNYTPLSLVLSGYV